MESKSPDEIREDFNRGSDLMRSAVSSALNDVLETLELFTGKGSSVYLMVSSYVDANYGDW